MKVLVTKFDSKAQLEPGQYTYLFQVYLPSWLPESTNYKTKKDRFLTEYTLRVQMIPKNKAKFVDDPRFPPGKFGKVSQFRGSRTIYIYKPYEEIAPVNYKLSL